MKHKGKVTLDIFQNFAYFMETKSYNIFKSKNATKLTKPIIESSYKVLLDKILFVTIKQPVLFFMGR